MENFARKIIVITGAARGIGRATAIAFAQAGAECIIGIDVCELVCRDCGVKPSTPIGGVRRQAARPGRLQDSESDSSSRFHDDNRRSRNQKTMSVLRLPVNSLPRFTHKLWQIVHI